MGAEHSTTDQVQKSGRNYPTIPVFNILHPESYESYPGNGKPPERPSSLISILDKQALDFRSIPAREMYVRVPYSNILKRLPTQDWEETLRSGDNCLKMCKAFLFRINKTLLVSSTIITLH